MIAPPYVARRWDPMASRLALGAKNVNCGMWYRKSSISSGDRKFKRHFPPPAGVPPRHRELPQLASAQRLATPVGSRRGWGCSGGGLPGLGQFITCQSSRLKLFLHEPTV